MINSSPSRSTSLLKLSIAMLTLSCTIFLSACNKTPDADEVSTIGTNKAAETNPDKIERNSMNDVAEAKAEDDQVAIAEADK